MGSNATRAIAEEPKVPGYMLLALQTMINGKPLSAFVDNGATFTSEKLRLHPPLNSIGAYFPLEMANIETIVSTRVALGVLVGIGKVQFPPCLTVVPLMKGCDLILDEDSLNAINSLVD